MIQASNKGRGTGMGRPYGKTVQSMSILPGVTNLPVNSFVGCGFDPANGTLFFTLNGQNLGIAFTGIPTTEGLYPAVCVQGESVELRANFGAEKFVYSYLEWGFFYEMLMKLGICLVRGVCGESDCYAGQRNVLLLRNWTRTRNAKLLSLQDLLVHRAPRSLPRLRQKLPQRYFSSNFRHI